MHKTEGTEAALGNNSLFKIKPPHPANNYVNIYWFIPETFPPSQNGIKCSLFLKTFTVSIVSHDLLTFQKTHLYTYFATNK